MLNIVIPPVSDCFMPTLGAAQIVSFLRSKGISTRLFDLSAELQQLVLNRYSLVFNLRESSLSLVQQYKLAIEYFFGNDLDYKLEYENFSSNWNWRKPNGYSKLLSTHRKLCKFFCQLPSFSELTHAEYIGFSVSYESQLIPALLLACLIKQRNSSAAVLFGGSFFYNYAEDFKKLLYESNFVNALIVGPGEEILLNIAQNGLNLVSTSDKMIFSRIGDNYIFNAQTRGKNFVVYEPDFSDLNFGNYLSPAKAFPYMIRNRCYYGGCKFCNGDRDCGTLQSKDINVAFRSMQKISERIGIKNVYLTDAALSPKDFRDISNIQNPIEISWIANARFERILNDYSLLESIQCKGCKMLRFGLESGSQKVLNLMNKGTDLEIATQIMQKMFKVGILVHVYIMFGYWGETPLDRKKTIQFLDNNKNYITSYSISVFQPIAKTKVYNELLNEAKKFDFGDETDDYSKIIAILYPDENGYRALLNDIEAVKNILRIHSFTNAEFYSANIFSDNTFENLTSDMSIQFLPTIDGGK